MGEMSVDEAVSSFKKWAVAGGLELQEAPGQIVALSESGFPLFLLWWDERWLSFYVSHGPPNSNVLFWMDAYHERCPAGMLPTPEHPWEGFEDALDHWFGMLS